jgi:hypothetical protein
MNGKYSSIPLYCVTLMLVEAAGRSGQMQQPDRLLDQTSLGD